MKVMGWVLLGGVGLLAAACGGKELRNVGELNSAAGSGGSADSNIGGATAGSASPPQTGTVFQEGLADVKSLATDTTTLYWVEYGSEDSLGNFQNDGRLLARDFDSEDVRVLAEDLPGAVDVVVTGRHAYIYVDQYIEGGGPRPALFRMTLAGADYALVRVLRVVLNETGNVCLGCVVSVDGAAYFVDDSIFRMSDEDPTPIRVLEQEGSLQVGSLAVDETTLYWTQIGETGTWQAPLTTGVATRVSTQSRRHLQASGAHLYGIDEEDDSSVFLARMPKDGGSGPNASLDARARRFRGE